MYAHSMWTIWLDIHQVPWDKTRPRRASPTTKSLRLVGMQMPRERQKYVARWSGIYYPVDKSGKMSLYLMSSHWMPLYLLRSVLVLTIVVPGHGRGQVLLQPTQAIRST